MLNLKLFGKNASVYALGNVSLRFGSFLMLPFYTHFFSIKEYGLFVTLTTTSQIVLILITAGTPTGFQRFAEDYQRNNELGTLFTSTILIIFCFSCLISVFIIVSLNNFFKIILHTDNVFIYCFLACILSISQAFFESIISIFRFKGQSIKFFFACVTVFLLLVVLTTLSVIIFNFGIKGAIASQIAAYGIGGLIYFVPNKDLVKIKLDKKCTIKLFAFSIPLVFSSASMITSEVSLVYLLSVISDLERVSIFSLSMKIASISGMLLIIPFFMAYEPFVYRNINNPKLREMIGDLFTYLLISFAFISFIIASAFKDGIRIFAPMQYYEAYSLSFFIYPVFAFKGIYYIGESLLSISKKTKIIGLMVMILNLIFLIISYKFVKELGLYGAIISYNMSNLCIAIIVFAIGIKYYSIPIKWNRICVAFASMFFLLISVYYLRLQAAVIFYNSIVLINLAFIYFVVYKIFLNDSGRKVCQAYISGVVSKIKKWKC